MVHVWMLCPTIKLTIVSDVAHIALDLIEVLLCVLALLDLSVGRLCLLSGS